jgi:hypothetical protein
MGLPRVRIVHRFITVVYIVMFVPFLALSWYALSGCPPDQLLMSAFLGESTVYARRYSESKFRSVRVGMTVRQVEAILGPPLRRGRCYAFDDVSEYSDQRTVTENFRRRWVVWRAGEVERVINDFFAD